MSLQINNIKMLNVRYVVELEGTGISHSFPTREQAIEYKKDMSRGFPSNEKMSEENREYWKTMSRSIKMYRERTIRVLLWEASHSRT